MPVCPICGMGITERLGIHLQETHGEEALRREVLQAKQSGLPDVDIGARYGISFRSLERLVTEATGANVSLLAPPKRITHWQPKNFRLETTTVWSFKQRGNWATHDGRYRGNWSPYIPRNLILRYSRPGEVVLDPFVGGGTTAVEAKLLGRRCIARDINPKAVEMTLANLDFTPPASFLNGLTVYEPDVKVGDARDLWDIDSGSVDLICAHPPYAGIIGYSTAVDGDLSQLSYEDYLNAMHAVATECFRVLKYGRHCAVLIGDTRWKKQVVPIGFQVIRLFLNVGFRLKELIIKRQHNCKTTGFWYENSIKWNFLLLAHEYLPVFEKPIVPVVTESRGFWPVPLSQVVRIERVRESTREKLETTTVWRFPPERVSAEIRRNLLARFAPQDGSIAEIRLGGVDGEVNASSGSPCSVTLVRFPNDGRSWTEPEVGRYVATLKRLADAVTVALPRNATLVIETQDVRVNGYVQPLALLAYEALREQTALRLREIVIVVPEGAERQPSDESLTLVHRYLLVFAYSG
jgi:hypothetical protein